MRPRISSRTLLLGLVMTPLSHALAVELCPVDPWRCERMDNAWVCSGQPRALESKVADPKARAAASTDLNAEQLKGTDGKTVILTGDAHAVRADQDIRADQIEYDIEKDSAIATGSVRYEDAANIFYADRAQARLAENETELQDVRYALKARRGQGRADVVVAHADGVTDLSEVTYTACSEADPAWQIEARELSIDQESGTATARDFKLRVGGIAVLYAPYASFPIDDRRKSGFLSPRVGVGSDGFDFAAPYYWNLAPNYDATMTPRWISDRGIQLGGEFRYLYPGGLGQFDLEYLPSDDILDRDRERFRWRHNGSLIPGLRLDADINHVSDDRYFVDLGNSLNTSATSVLGSVFALSGGGRKWRWSVLADRYELILPDVPEDQQADPYERMPRAFVEYFDRSGGLTWGGGAEFVNFRRDDACVLSGADCTRVDFDEGRRLDVAPYLGYAWEPSFGFLRARGSLRHTRYELDRSNVDPLGNCAVGCDDMPSRTTPIFSLDGGLVYERENAFGQSQWRQTLEPRLFYLRVPYRDQSQIPVFDSAPLDFSFAQLFRENRYTGADRQIDANQLTLALTSRLLDDDSGVERAAISIGQIQYFDEPRVYLPSELALLTAAQLDDQLSRQRSAWVSEVRARVTDTWSLIGGFRYDPELDRTDFGAVRLQKRFAQEGLLNLGYRYRPDRLEQTDISALIPINDQWRAVFRWNYSLREHTTLEAVAGFEFRSCCYAVRLLSRNYLRGVGDERRNAIFLELELTGLGSVGRDTGDFLRRAILGYQPFEGPF